MTPENAQKNDKTVLNRKKWYNRKIGAIMTALAIAAAPLALTGCDEAPQSNDDQAYTEQQQADDTENVPEDIAQLDNAAKSGELVQGRQGCIDKLVKNGLTADEAGKVCDEITAEAQQQLKDKQPAATQPAQPVQGTNQTTVVVHDNGGSNAMFWYWLGSSSHRPYVYYGSPSGGMTIVHNHYDSGSSGGGVTHPPEHLTSNQSTYLATEHAMRPAVTEHLAARPGVKVVAVPHFTHDGVHTTTHVTSGKSSSHSSVHTTISHGGFGGHGVSTGG